ncbi:MAG: hypothetical protein WBP46_09425 [Thiolinea sp.]
MSSLLQLNEKQKTDVAEINLEYLQRYNVLMESTKPDVDKVAWPATRLILLNS